MTERERREGDFLKKKPSSDVSPDPLASFNLGSAALATKEPAKKGGDSDYDDDWGLDDEKE